MVPVRTCVILAQTSGHLVSRLVRLVILGSQISLIPRLLPTSPEILLILSRHLVSTLWNPLRTSDLTLWDPQTPISTSGPRFGTLVRILTLRFGPRPRSRTPDLGSDFWDRFCPQPLYRTLGFRPLYRRGGHGSLETLLVTFLLSGHFYLSKQLGCHFWLQFALLGLLVSPESTLTACHPTLILGAQVYVR